MRKGQISMDFGLIFLDKPRGPSSHEVTSFVKKILGAEKCGHAGTLDPQVSGVLVIGVNKATRLLRFITSKKKRYVGVMRLREPPKRLEEVQAVMDRFVGKIPQIPPKKSAVRKKRRFRVVYSFKAHEIDGRDVLFDALVEAGTYIRVLCSEVGKSFGAGQMVELRRTAVEDIEEKMICTLSQLEDAIWLAKNKDDHSQIDLLIHAPQNYMSLPLVYVPDSAVDTFCRGASLDASGVASVEDGVCDGQDVQVCTREGKLLGIAIYREDGKKRVISPKVVINQDKK